MGGEQIVAFLFKFQNEEPLNQKFGEFGFESMNFLETSGSIIFPICIYMLTEFLIAYLVNLCALYYRNYY